MSLISTSSPLQKYHFCTFYRNIRYFSKVNVLFCSLFLYRVWRNFVERASILSYPVTTYLISLNKVFSLLQITAPSKTTIFQPFSVFCAFSHAFIIKFSGYFKVSNSVNFYVLYFVKIHLQHAGSKFSWQKLQNCQFLPWNFTLLCNQMSPSTHFQPLFFTQVFTICQFYNVM